MRKTKYLTFVGILFFFGLSCAARAFQATSSTARRIIPEATLPSTCSVANGEVHYLTAGAAADRGCYECCSGLAGCPSPPWRRCGNPVPAASGITGSGTAGTVPIFSAASVIGDSLLTYASVSPKAWIFDGLENSFGGASTSGLYLGNGRTSATPISGVGINATGGSGTNVSGTTLFLNAGRGTGNLKGGSMAFQLSPAGAAGSTVNPLVTYGTIDPATGWAFNAPVSVTNVAANSFLYSGTGSLVTAITPTDGQLLIGDTGGPPLAGTITAGSGITVTNGPGTITIAASGGGGGTAPIIEAKSKVAVTSNLVFPNVFVGAGSGWKHFDGLGVTDATTLNADATWALAFEMPPALPTGTATLRTRCISALSSGALKYNPKWNMCGTAEDCSSVTLNAEGTQTVTYTVAGAFVEVDTTLDASTVAAGKTLIMNWVVEDTGTTAAGNSTCTVFVVFL